MPGEAVTIKITPALKKKLDGLKRFPRESYDEVISRLALQAEEDRITDEDIRDIGEALEDIKAGRVYTSAELKKALGLD
jgi:predicted transcriptional regulator